MAGVTPTPPLSTFLDGQTLAAAPLNTIGTHANALFAKTMAGFRTKKPLVVVKATAAFTPAVSIDTVMPWQAEVLDFDNMFTTANPTVVTINTAGWYRLALQVHFDAAANGIRACKIMVNGTNPATNAVATDDRNPVATGEGTVIFCQRVAKLAAGATLYTNVYTSAASSTITTFSGSFFSAEWVAPYS